MHTTTRRVPVPTTPPLSRAGRARGLLLGLSAGAAAGAVLGCGLRGFMRLVASDPAFTWSGTLFVVGLFAAFGATQGLAAAGRIVHLRRPALTILRAVGTAGMLLTMMGAGMLLAPTVLGGGLAAHRTSWPRWLRAACATIAVLTAAAVAVGLGAELGFGLRALAGTMAMVVGYGVLVAMTGATLRPQPDGWAPARRPSVVAATATLAVGATLLGLAVVGAG